MENKIILSTGNIDKIEEIEDILKGLPFSIYSKKEVGLGDLEIEEDGATLKDNAIKKALAISDKVDGVVIADDTGLFVDELNGKPGVYSSRYAGEGCSYMDNNIKLLEELKKTPLKDRTATFKTVIAIVTKDKEVKTVYGECKGKIGFKPKGSGGFGYDPLFIVDGFDKTFAQLGEEIKNKISHRAIALEKLKKELEKLLEDD